jgi:predicted nucleotidyltransferase
MQNHKTAMLDFGVNRIGLFGSYVRNEQTPHSDIDILVDFSPEKENYDNFMALYDYLENLFDKKIEVVTVNGLSPYIKPYILNEVAYV